VVAVTRGAVAQVRGTVVPLRGDDIDTDRIIPARFVKSTPYDELGRCVLADDRAEAARSGKVHPFDADPFRDARILVVEANFGCGSSREHAVAALAGWGVAAVVGCSFSNIFAANALANGIPCVSTDRPSVQRLMGLTERCPSTAVTVDIDRLEVSVAEGGWTVAVTLPPGGRSRLLDGSWDPLERLLANSRKVAEVAAALPYLAWKCPDEEPSRYKTTNPYKTPSTEREIHHVRPGI
jgi:3-isopropylmalate/(R)-2-methylmalate dehydratase small subunit